MISSQHGHALKTAHIQVVCIECRYRLSRSPFRISWAGITLTLSAEVGGWLLGLRMGSVAGPHFFFGASLATRGGDYKCRRNVALVEASLLIRVYFWTILAGAWGHGCGHNSGLRVLGVGAQDFGT